MQDDRIYIQGLRQNNLKIFPSQFQKIKLSYLLGYRDQESPVLFLTR